MTLNAGLLLIKGDAGQNHVKIFDSGLAASSAQNNITVQADGVTQHFKHVQRIQVNTFSGQDTVSYQLTGPLQPGIRTVGVDLGTGADRFTSSLKGDVLAGAELDLSVLGDPKSDEFGSPDGMLVVADKVTIAGALKIDLDGDWGNDVMVVGYTGHLSGQLQVDVHGSLGADTALVGLSFDAPSTGIVSAHVAGDLGPDTLGLFLTGSVPASANAVLATDAADTSVAHSPNVQVV
jgi:hypothetical protein